jgi:hypothetical protein
MKNFTENGANNIYKKLILIMKQNSKGFVEEITWIVTIIMATVIIALFIYNQQSGGIEVTKTVEERVLNEEGISILFSLSNDKPPYVEKYYSQILVDAVLQGTFLIKDTDKVFYGNGIGTVNSTEIIPPLIKKFTTKNWKLNVVTPDGSRAYGSGGGEILYSYEIPVPVPEERIGKIVFQLS